MSSTRNTLPTLCLFAVGMATGGCLKQPAPPAPVSHAPLVIDDAMERRRWATVPAKYQNGQTPAWPTGFILAHRPDAPRWLPALTDTPLFLANVFAMPIGYAFTPGWTRVNYATGEVEPTYHAMPPLPPPTK